jgi:hypothetical protein
MPIINNASTFLSSLNVSGNTILANVTTCVSSLNVSGNTTLANFTTCLSTLSGTTINATQKIFFNNTLAAAPALGTLGGNGDRIILYAGTGGTYPYSLGIADFTQFYSVPFDSVHRMFIAGTNRFEVAAGAVSVNTSLTNNGNINITSRGTNNLIFDNVLNNKKIQLNSTNGFGLVSNGINFFSSGGYTFYNGTLTTVIYSVDSAGSMSTNGTIYPAGGLSTSSSIRAGNIGIGTAASANASLTLFSSTQTLSRIIFSGQEFFQAATTSTDGIAMLLLGNRLGNRQIGFADSANLAVNATNPILRNYSVDCLSTNGTRLQIQFGGVLYTGDNGINIGMNTTSYKSAATVLTVSGSSSGYTQPIVQITQTGAWDGNYCIQTKGYANIGGDGSATGLRINGEDTGNTIYQNGDRDMGLTVNNANMYFNTNGANRMYISGALVMQVMLIIMC